MSCQVIAPSLIPCKPGERIKTNRRDARKLAELFRAGLLTEVRPPTPEAEAVRDLCRARDDAREDLQRSRHRLGTLLLRGGCITAAAVSWASVVAGPSHNGASVDRRPLIRPIVHSPWPASAGTMTGIIAHSAEGPRVGWGACRRISTREA